MRRLLVFILAAFVAAFVVAVPSQAFASAPVDQSGSGDQAATTPTTITTIVSGDPTDTTIDNSFLDTERNITECLNNSVELPGCGREPQQQGDRGGALQLVTFGLLFVGVGFIFWRVARGIKARDAAIAAKMR
ncbi:MAG: hypothetical protein ABIR32_15570 [Ilumatobacteraceae bacterium]